MYKGKKVIFASKMIALTGDSFSTDIMTYNLVLGLHQAGCSVVFLCICESGREADKQRLLEQFSPITEKVIILPSLIGLENGKYTQLLKMVESTFRTGWYARQLPADLCVAQDTVLISHAPAIEGILYCNELRRRERGKRLPFIQYWSDPIALSGISNRQYSYKRWVHAWIERRLLRSADVIVYGTAPLMSAQKQRYGAYAEKMRFIDVSYKVFGTDESPRISADPTTFLYAGGYYSRIRNIAPLFEAVKKLNGQVRLDVYGSGDVEPGDTEHIVTHGRVSPKEMEVIEGTYRNTISLLNSDCVQIPGKTFYNTNLPQNILVILDGPVKEEIKEYLERYNRFVLCENNERSIREMLVKMMNNTPNIEYAKEQFSPKAVSESLLRTLSKQQHR